MRICENILVSITNREIELVYGGMGCKCRCDDGRTSYQSSQSNCESWCNDYGLDMDECTSSY